MTYSPAAATEYLDTPFMDEQPTFTASILTYLAFRDAANWKDATHYPKVVKVLFETNNSGALYWSQRMHVRALLKASKGTEALSEARRLFAITPLESALLSDAVQVVSIAVRGDALAKGKNLKEALAAQNAYLEGIKKADVSQTAFAGAPFPVAHAVATAQEGSTNFTTSLDALLFNGKFDEAQKKVDGLLASAVDEAELQLGIWAAGRVANAKSGVPTAANRVTQ